VQSDKRIASRGACMGDLLAEIAHISSASELADVERDGAIWLLLATRGEAEERTQSLFEMLATLSLGKEAGDGGLPPSPTHTSRSQVPRMDAHARIKYGMVDVRRVGAAGGALLSDGQARKLVLFETEGAGHVELPFDPQNPADVFRTQDYLAARIARHSPVEGGLWQKWKGLGDPKRPRFAEEPVTRPLGLEGAARSTAEAEAKEEL